MSNLTMSESSTNTSNVYKIPVSYQRESNVVGNAFVDRDLLPYIMRFKWFLSDPRKPRTPKTQMRINGTPKSILLNRLVFTLEGLDEERRDQLTSRINIVVLYKIVEAQPKLKYRRNDPFDCRFENIEIMTRGVDPSLQDEHEESEVVDWNEEKKVIAEEDAKDMKAFLEKRADDLKRKKAEDERRKHEVPDELVGTDPLGILERDSSRVKEVIEKTEAEHKDMINNLFSLMDQNKPNQPPNS